MKMRLEIQVPEPSILMQISSDPISLSSFSQWSHSISNMVEQRWWRRLGGEKREIEDQGRRGTGLLLTRAYQTCPVFAGRLFLFQKFILLIPIPFSIITQSKRYTILDLNRESPIFLSSAINCFSLFQIFGINMILLTRERDSET